MFDDNDAIEQENRADTLFERKAVAAIERKQGYIVADAIGDSWPEPLDDGRIDFDRRVPLTPAEAAQEAWTNGPDGPRFCFRCKHSHYRELTPAEIADIADIMGVSLTEQQKRDMADIAAFEQRARLDANLDYDTAYLDSAVDNDDRDNERPVNRSSKA